MKVRFGGNTVNLTFEGIVDKFARKYIACDAKTYSARTQKAVAPYIPYGPCPPCTGERLNQAALNCKINGQNIAQLAALEVNELIEVLQDV